MILGGDGAGVRYAMVRYDMPRRWPMLRSHYELVRHEGDWAETLAQGVGLRARRRIVAFLCELAELDGPDAPAALAGLRAGWSVVTVPWPP